MASFADDAAFVAQVDDTIEGFPLYLSFLTDELSQTAKAGQDVRGILANTPRGFTQYVSKQFETIEHSEDVRYRKELREMFYFMTVAKGELSSEDLAEPELLREAPVGIPWQVSRWFTIREQQDQVLFSFAHPTLAEEFAKLPKIKANTSRCLERLVEYCARWQEHKSRYALRYYAQHLHEAGRQENMFALLRGPFLEYKAERIGIREACADCALAAQVAAEGDDDTNLLRMIERASGLEKGVARGWQSGRFILSLLEDDAKLILSRASILAVETLPWSAFLAAERVFVLGETDLALELLRQVVQREWPKYQPPTHAHGMAEGSAWDFLGKEEEFIPFVAKVATADVSLSLELIGRLFADRPGILPNPKTAWREVMRILKTQELSPAFYRNLFEATNDWFKSSPIFGTRTLVMELFDILPRTLPSEDLTWMANALLSCLQLRFAACESSEEGFFWACADTLEAILKLHQECSESHPQRPVLLETAQKVASSLPTVETPSEGSRTNRSMTWARLARCLQICGSDRWREFADAALVACEKDGALDDPNLIAVGQALSLLHDLEDPEIGQRVQEITKTLGSRLEESINRQQEPLDKDDSDSTPLREQLLKRFTEEHDPYRRGRIALEVYRRGLASVAELATALASVVRGSTDEESLRFEDALAEALIQILMDCGEPWAAESISKLEASRSPQRREKTEINQSNMEMRIWNALAKNGHDEHLKQLLQARVESAIEHDDLTQLLNCCSGAILFDPDLADCFYHQMPEDLDPIDRGFAVVMLIDWLAYTHPNRLHDLGMKWVTDLPEVRFEEEIAEYEIEMCSSWGRRGIFRPQLISVIRHISLAMMEKYHSFKAPLPKKVTGPAAEESQREQEKVWRWMGSILDAVGQIRIEPSDGSEAEVSGMVNSIRSLLGDLDFDQKDRAISALLKKIHETHPPGPVTRFLCEQFDYLNGAGAYIELGLELATCLKEAEPSWAERRAQEAIAYWKDLLTEEKPAEEILERAARVLADSLVSAFRGFRNARELDLWELTEDLVRWAVKLEDARKVLLFLQEQIEQARDRDLRALLLAQVAGGWLQIKDFTKVTDILEVVNFTSLRRASFYDKLLATPGSKILDELLDTLKMLLIRLLLGTPTSDDAFVDVLVTWFDFRLRSIADRQARIQFIKRMLEAHAQWREANPNMAKS